MKKELDIVELRVSYSCKENPGDFENERTKVSTAYNSTLVIWYCSTEMPGIAFTYWTIFGDLIKKS